MTFTLRLISPTGHVVLSYRELDISDVQSRLESIAEGVTIGSRFEVIPEEE